MSRWWKKAQVWGFYHKNEWFQKGVEGFSHRNSRMTTVPGEWGGGIHMSTTPWPSRTDMPPLAFPLNAPRSESTNDKLSEPHSCCTSTCRADKHHPCRQLSAYFIWSRPEVWLHATWIKPSFLISLDIGHALQSVCFFLEVLSLFFFESFSRFWGYSWLFWTGQLKVKLAINPYWQRLAAWSYKVPGMLANDELSLMARCLPVVSF